MWFTLNSYYLTIWFNGSNYKQQIPKKIYSQYKCIKNFILLYFFKLSTYYIRMHTI